jgi:hypothetical protein
MKTNKILALLFFVVIGNIFTSYSQSKVVRYSLLDISEGCLTVLKENVPKSKIKNHFYKKSTFIDSTLRNSSIYDNKGLLYDDTYSNAITIIEYENGLPKYEKLYDRYNQRIEDGFLGYWSIEFSFDNKGRIIQEIYRDKNNGLVKYVANIDFKPPYLEYEYTSNKCIRKWLDNNRVVQYIDTCSCPILDYRLK